MAKMPPKKKRKKVKVVVSFRIDPDLIAKIDSIAKRSNYTRNEYVTWIFEQAV